MKKWVEVISIENKILNFTVKDQHLKRIDDTFVVNKLRNILLVRFEFDHWWDGLNIFAIFKNKNDSYSLSVNVEDGIGECVVPHEVLDERWFRMTLYGGDLLTTNEVTIYLDESGYTTDISSTSEATQDVFVQVYDELDGKADVNHTHAISDVDNLNNELESIHNELNQKSNVGHNHTSNDVTDLEDSMNVDVKRALNSLAGSIRTYGE